VRRNTTRPTEAHARPAYAGLGAEGQDTLTSRRTQICIKVCKATIGTTRLNQTVPEGF